MVRITQQKIEGASKRVKESIIEVKKFLEKDITDQTHNKMTLSLSLKDGSRVVRHGKVAPEFQILLFSNISLYLHLSHQSSNLG